MKIDNLKEPNKHQFLPDFCALNIVFPVVIIGELFAIILTLSSVGFKAQAWDSLAVSSLYIQWNGLLSIAFLCILRKYTSYYNRYLIASLSYFSLLLLFLIISEIAYQLIFYMDMQIFMSVSDRLSFHLKNLIIGGIISGIVLRYFYIQHQWEIQIQAKAQTNLKLLQARIRPHFLFNSMNTIASLTRSNAKLAEQVTIDLADLFRILFEENTTLVTWDKELQIAKQYLAIESLRFADRLKIEWKVGDIPDNAQLPLLTLQPILENAIYHGIEPSIDGGSIVIEARKIAYNIQIIITNSQEVSNNTRVGNQMAIENIRQRLAASFGNEASLNLQETQNEFLVSLNFPYKANL